MANNYLEELVAEWYDFRGYLVKRNVLVGKLVKGGYECELDIVAFNPHTKHLVHVEPTHDAHDWKKRETRFTKKFTAGKKYIPGLFPGIPLPDKIEHICLLGFGSNTNHPILAGATVMTIADFIEEILRGLAGRNMHRNAMSENQPLLRTLQFITQNRKRFAKVLGQI